MKLSTRLWLYGALVPTLLLVAAFALLGLLLQRELLASVDRALLAQAAVESVSLFDRMDHAPHLHLDRSPLPSSVRLPSATGALYGPDGTLLAREPATAIVPAVLPWTAPDSQPHLQTLQEGGLQVRELRISVAAPDGRPHLLRLATSLAQMQATVAAYVRAASLTALLAAAGLLALQLRHARAVHGRVMRLHRHMQELHAGNLAVTPPADSQGDVLAELRDAIAEATDRLRSAREEQERLLADAAHELRTPLAAMRTDIDVTLRRERSAAELRETLARTRDEVDRLADLASRLLDLAATRQARWLVAEQDVVPVLADARDCMVAAAVERGVQLQLDAPASLLAPVDGAALRQVVDNLLANAVRFAESRVRVVVRVEAAVWLLRVEDDGPGVPAAQAQAIFEPFHRPDKRGPGSGLGLAIVRDLVLRLGGTVRLVPESAPGAVFEVTLPRA